jgi:acetyltransferase-like isoleucine patch superfamily enzyme
MTLLSTFLAFFPALVLVAAGASVCWLCFAPSIFSILAIGLSLYGLPLLAHYLHGYFHPIAEGISYLRGDNYSPWWGSHQIQSIYIAFPALETLLRLIPGAFSVWLRLWGAQIGRDVYWTSQLEIADRSLIIVGDRVVFGYQVTLVSHIIKPKKDDLMLYVKKIEIGNDVFLGARSQLGAGAKIKDGTFLPILTHVYPNQEAT